MNARAARCPGLARVLALSATLVLSPSIAAAQTIFDTADFRQDRAHWTDPAYYRYNTVAELRGMALDIYGSGTGQAGAARPFGSEGTGRVGASDLASPYPFTTAAEHYRAWRAAARGGTGHTLTSLPDWGGRWEVADDAFDGGANPASAVAAILTPQYREYFVQEIKAASEGRIWSPGAFCLPGGFARATISTEEIIVTSGRVWMLGADNGSAYIRRIYTDGSGHTDEDFRYPKWHGESIGFWDGDSLIVYTNQIRGWKGTLVEFTDDLETIERYRRVDNMIEGEITLYDPAVFERPVYSHLTLELDPETRPELRPLYNTCTDTNGPSTKVFLDERGLLNERLPGDPLYWDVNDPRPWGTFFNASDERYKAYLESRQPQHD